MVFDGWFCGGVVKSWSRWDDELLRNGSFIWDFGNGSWLVCVGVLRGGVSCEYGLWRYGCGGNFVFFDGYGVCRGGLSGGLSVIFKYYCIGIWFVYYV